MNERLKSVLQEITRIAKKQRLDPFEITRTKFLQYSKLNISASQLERLGSFKSIVTENFGASPTKLDLSSGFENKTYRAYVKKLEKIVSKPLYLINEVSRSVNEQLLKFKFPIPPKIKKPLLSSNTREVVAVISDTHFGLEIDESEIGGANVYNWIIAARRMGLFVNQIATFKEECRKQTPNLRLCLSGDLAQGLIHLSDANTNLISYQIIGTVHILYQMIAYLRNFFKNIYIECTTDNHLRMIHKGEGRATAQKFDSYATIIHHSLAMGFKHCKDVHFHIPHTPYTAFEVLGNRFYMTHGDTLINVGMPGKKINTDLITNSANKLNASLKDKDEYKVIIVGHVHTPTFITLDNGTELVVNGTGSGLDPFAQSISIFESNPAQVMFESTKQFPVGDQRKVFLKYADKDSSWEDIIKPYKYTLEPK